MKKLSRIDYVLKLPVMMLLALLYTIITCLVRYCVEMMGDILSWKVRNFVRTWFPTIEEYIQLFRDIIEVYKKINQENKP
jgi:hypothetical protein